MSNEKSNLSLWENLSWEEVNRKFTKKSHRSRNKFRFDRCESGFKREKVMANKTDNNKSFHW
jgi:Asp-tRNA(Asn)/Glu-tRNA(Gln) amidotransferase C subunit